MAIRSIRDSDDRHVLNRAVDDKLLSDSKDDGVVQISVQLSASLDGNVLREDTTITWLGIGTLQQRSNVDFLTVFYLVEPDELRAAFIGGKEDSTARAWRGPVDEVFERSAHDLVHRPVALLARFGAISDVLTAFAVLLARSVADSTLFLVV